MLSYIIIASGYHVYIMCAGSRKTSFALVIHIFYRVQLIISDFRFILEFGVFWSIYISIADRLGYLLIVISKKIVLINERAQIIISDSTNYIAMYGNIKDLDKWSATYDIIEIVANLCNSILYFQVHLLDLKLRLLLLYFGKKITIFLTDSHDDRRFSRW